ncbi:ee7d8d41-9a73-41dd-b20c-f92610a89b78 [Sclerotinia trifoliorum]|uniref:Ee7d8d41-9a73-41dd-b20c-f92610a89b78 n=1 Tax=Sclerotinia trifoliorum TaxID=28548 RepID=A0A8H2VUF8_9HELO|nr:ee7d8d41-9a73-41dd-b20c-f92610a89b78 [Sclerotinia trifoliorum]
MSRNNSAYQPNHYSTGQQPQYNQYQQSQGYHPQYQYQNSTHQLQGQTYQQNPHTQFHSTHPGNQQLTYQNPSYHTNQHEQTTYQNRATTWAPQYQQQQTQTQHQYVQPTQLTRQSLQSLPTPGRNNVNVYLRDDQNFERVPQSLETRRDTGLAEWERGWDAAGRR